MVSAVATTYRLLPCRPSGCTTGAPSQVNVDRPESQEVLVSNETCLQFGRGCLSGAAIALFWLWLLACLSAAGDGPVRSQLALLSPLFCEWGWQVSYVRAFCRIAIPQSGLLSQVSSLRLSSGHSGPVLTLSNAASASLPRPRLLVADIGVCTASPMGVTVGHVICGF